jgi:hypothetical protein
MNSHDAYVSSKFDGSMRIVHTLLLCVCVILCGHECLYVCSDVGVKEYLVWLDASGAVESFILREIDDRHLFVTERENLFTELQEFLDAWHDVCRIKLSHTHSRLQE